MIDIPLEIFDITSAVTELPRVRRFLRDFCRQHIRIGFNDTYMIELELAVNEATANIMKHAYHGRPDRFIRIEASSGAETVTVRLLHNGDTFSPENVPPPSFDGSRENGFGVYLIERCVDEVKYSCDSQGQSCVYLSKRYTDMA